MVTHYATRTAEGIHEGRSLRRLQSRKAGFHKLPTNWPMTELCLLDAVVVAVPEIMAQISNVVRGQLLLGTDPHLLFDTACCPARDQTTTVSSLQDTGVRIVIVGKRRALPVLLARCPASAKAGLGQQRVIICRI
jgi:hypothetical protein